MISKDDILGLAELARLKLKSGEEESLVKDISSILGYVGQVQSFAAIPTDTQAAVRNVFREDIPRAPGDLMAGKEESLKAQFPTREGDHNVVRKIIQKDE
jgi:aspartyl/glutamyl-tRNA(Asn/Gln) amidotransferase C subunit